MAESASRRRRNAVTAGQVALTTILVAIVCGSSIPLGVPGEWAWSRITVRPSPVDVLLASLGLLAYTGVSVAGFRHLGREGPRKAGLAIRSTQVGGLALAGLGMQLVLMSAAPTGMGLVRWATLGVDGASGYLNVARREADGGLGPFLARYPVWIRGQDALHIGTHPPGLIVAAHAARAVLVAHPERIRSVLDRLPREIADGFRVMVPKSKPLDRAAMALLGLTTLLLAAATVVPLYALARAELGPAGAWAAAAAWAVVPAVIMFHPTADSAYPFLATSALALAAWAGRTKGRVSPSLAVLSGAALAIGMLFTLAFLAVGLIAAFLLRRPGRPWREWAGLLLATGAGFLAGCAVFWATTSANPFAIWWANQANHARFYVEYPRTYSAWLLITPVEVAAALGGAASVAAAAGLSNAGRWPGVSLLTLAVMALLALTGRNLSEVARLWLPLMPGLLVATGRWMEQSGARFLAISLVLQGAQVLAFEAAIQTVYPVTI